MPLARYLCLALLLLCFSACGRSSTDIQPAEAQPQPTPKPGLPSPSELEQRPRQSAYVQSDLGCDASHVSPLLALHRATAESNYLLMHPVSFPDHSETPERLAYALYDFSLGGYDLAPSLRLEWIKAPDTDGLVSVGLANFDSDRWDWFSAPVSGELDLGSMQHYIKSGSGHCYVLVLAAGEKDLLLSHLRFAPAYDETEGSQYEVFNTLPREDFVGFLGSIGTGLGYPGYDGDDTDSYLLNRRAGDTLDLSLSFDGSADLNMMLQDLSTSTTYVVVSGVSPLQIHRVMQADEPGPYLLTVTTNSGFSDYSLSCQTQFAPVARISCDLWKGSAPLSVHFNAGLSADSDGQIVKYEWDWEGDGSFELDSGSNPQASHSYPVDGAYRPTVRCTDDDGSSSSAAATVTVGALPYNEVENNDSFGELTRLPSLPFSGYQGSIGTSVGNPGYDGDTADFYQLYFSPGKKVWLQLDFDPLTSPDTQLLLFGPDDILPETASTVAPGRLVLGTTVRGSGDQPYLLYVACGNGGESDYSLSAGNGRPPRAAFVVNHSTGVAPLDISFNAAASDDDGSIVKYEWDWDGDYIFDQNSGGLSSAVHNFQLSGVQHVNLRVTDDEGLSATSAMTILVWPHLYEEIEPNNNTSQAKQVMPTLPFSGFRGNVGEDGSNDGSKDDVYPIEGLQVGDTFRVTVTSDKNSADLLILLLEGDGSGQAGSSSTDSGTEVVERTIQANDILPLKVLVRANSGTTDYQLAVEQL